MGNERRSGRRFSIRGLLGLVGASGITTYALANASIYWGAIFFSTALLVLAIGFLGALFRRGTRQAFWIGFVVLGAGYMVLLYAPRLDVAIGHRLVSTKVLGFLETKMRRTPDPLAKVFRAPPSQVATNAVDEAVLQFVDEEHLAPQWAHFQEIGHSVIAMVLALLGARAAEYFAST